MFKRIDNRIVIIAIITILVAMTFWLGSRIPNLNEKAMMGGATELEALGFDQVFKIEPEDGFFTRVIYTTFNWVDTNKRGMTFGVTLAACLMTLLSLFKRKSFRNSFANAIMGTFIGAPLGVCVNCAAPIAKGLHAAGTRLETTLSTMISSPTMNIIVLTMLFSLFPWYMVATKIGFTLLFIVIGIPLICRLVYSHEQLEEMSQKVSVPAVEGETCELPSSLGAAKVCAIEPQSWGLIESLKWVPPTLLGNFWYIIKTTVPLMFLAGFMGSLFIVALPWDSIVSTLPHVDGMIITLIMMIGLALFGVFLPVPIAFDVIVVAILMAAGLPAKYGMVLLFTLGIFSIYSFHIVWHHISKPVAVVVFLAVAGFGVVAGVTAHYVSAWDDTRQQEMMYNMFLSDHKLVEAAQYTKPPTGSDIELLKQLHEDAQTAQAIEISPQQGLNLSYLPFHPAKANGSKQFSPMHSIDLGIDDPSPFTLRRIIPPHYWGRGIATGDVHQDGWPDLLVASDNLSYKGIALYANRKGKTFTEQRIDIPAIEKLKVLNAALIDINNDGWLDIFISAYRGGNHIIYNKQGRFLQNNLVTLPANKAAVAAAVAFADVDKDGDLDIVLGNWSLGMFRRIVPGEAITSQNILLIQQNGEFKAQELKSFPGETLSTLFTDFNHDGNLDLIVGNDYESPDNYFRGDGKGGFIEVLASDGLLPHTTESTMSIASADINNDLKAELYLGQITKGVGAGFAKKMRPAEAECDDVKGTALRKQCIELLQLNSQVNESRLKQDAASCLNIDDALMRQDCMSLHVLWSAWMKKDKTFCKMIPALQENFVAICHEMFEKHVVASEDDLTRAIKQIRNFNVLLVADGDKHYIDQAKSFGLEITGWTWNAKFADVDNDEWQDLYVANGRFPNANREPNFFFKNMAGKKFENHIEQYGLQDYHATGAFSYVDFDADGDLDIITVPANAPIKFYLNNTQNSNSVIIELRDHIGNYSGIGSKIFIRYGTAGEKQQMRELQASGGFISFDEPGVHFGLGEHDVIKEIEVHWSTGQSTLSKGDFASNGRYIIERNNQ